jgi:hypothetical protein
MYLQDRILAFCIYKSQAFVLIKSKKAILKMETPGIVIFQELSRSLVIIGCIKKFFEVKD